MNATLAHWVTVTAKKFQGRQIISKLKWLIRKAALGGRNYVGICPHEDYEEAAIIQWTEQNGYKYRKDDGIYWVEW